MQAAVHQDPPRDRSEDRAWAIEAPWGLAKYAPIVTIASVASAAPLDRVGSELVGLVRLSRGTLQDDLAMVVVGASG